MPRSANGIDNSPKYPEHPQLWGHMFAVRVEEQFGMSMRLKGTRVKSVLGSSELVLSMPVYNTIRDGCTVYRTSFQYLVRTLGRGKSC